MNIFLLSALFVFFWTWLFKREIRSASISEMLLPVVVLLASLSSLMSFMGMGVPRLVAMATMLLTSLGLMRNGFKKIFGTKREFLRRCAGPLPNSLRWHALLYITKEDPGLLANISWAARTQAPDSHALLPWLKHSDREVRRTAVAMAGLLSNKDPDQPISYLG